MRLLVVAMALLGCKNSQPPATPASAPEPGAKTGRTSSAPLSENDISRIAKTSAWGVLKAVWKKLDAVAPNKDAEYSQYSQTLTGDQSNALRQQLDAASQALGTELNGALSSLERDTLVRICQDRIENMEDGFAREMVAHVAPPPFSGERRRLIANLETKIDALLELREKAVLDPKELKLALAAAQREVLAYAAYQSLSRGPGLFYLYGDAEQQVDLSSLDALRAEIERQKNSRAVSQNPSAQSSDDLDAVLRALDETSKILPRLSALVADLES